MILKVRSNYKAKCWTKFYSNSNFGPRPVSYLEFMSFSWKNTKSHSSCWSSFWWRYLSKNWRTRI